jgi:hypothetical protein
MGDILQVDFAKLRAARQQAKTQAHNQRLTMNDSQEKMLRLSAAKLNDIEMTELGAALEDLECYNQACDPIKLLVDIYHSLGE